MVKTGEYYCKHCGTVWEFRTQAPGTHTGWSGFLLVRVRLHIEECLKRTPKERCAWADRTLKRLAKYPNQHTQVIIDRFNPGYQGECGKVNDAR